MKLKKPTLKLSELIALKVLQNIAQHSLLSTTQSYIDVNDAMKRKAIDLI